MIRRRNFIAIFGATILGASIAGEPLSTDAQAAKAKVFEGSTSGVAINGYDPVGYFTQNKPVKGSPEFTTNWKGSNWHFASAQNRDNFIANPEKFAPQFGGFCAYAVSYGSTAKTEPDAWSIVDNKLYLNFSQAIRERWKSDIPGNISKANKNWPHVLN